MNLVQLAVVAGLLAWWTGALLVRDRFAPPAFAPAVIKFTHALPAILQLVLFAYWSLYWPMVFAHLPVLCVQLFIAYAFDLLLAWSARRPYSPNLGPVPIVLSANLFVWFHPGDLLLYALVIAVALASKGWRVDQEDAHDPGKVVLRSRRRIDPPRRGSVPRRDCSRCRGLKTG